MKERADGERIHGAVFAASSSEDLRLAAEGLSGASQSLPFLGRIRASFGHHSLDGVRVRVGGPAATAGTALGARAYAFGEELGFARAPSLRLAAHEVTHVLQQRYGARLDSAGQRAAMERQADEVAARVVAGRSVEPVLDRLAAHRRPATRALQLAAAPATLSAAMQRRARALARALARRVRYWVRKGRKRPRRWETKRLIRELQRYGGALLVEPGKGVAGRASERRREAFVRRVQAELAATPILVPWPKSNSGGPVIARRASDWLERMVAAAARSNGFKRSWAAMLWRLVGMKVRSAGSPREAHAEIRFRDSELQRIEHLVRTLEQDLEDVLMRRHRRFDSNKAEAWLRNDGAIEQGLQGIVRTLREARGDFDGDWTPTLADPQPPPRKSLSPQGWWTLWARFQDVAERTRARRGHRLAGRWLFREVRDRLTKALRAGKGLRVGAIGGMGMSAALAATGMSRSPKGPPEKVRLKGADVIAVAGHYWVNAHEVSLGDGKHYELAERLKGTGGLKGQFQVWRDLAPQKGAAGRKKAGRAVQLVIATSCNVLASRPALEKVFPNALVLGYLAEAPLLNLGFVEGFVRGLSHIDPRRNRAGLVRQYKAFIMANRRRRLRGRYKKGGVWKGYEASPTIGIGYLDMRNGRTRRMEALLYGGAQDGFRWLDLTRLPAGKLPRGSTKADERALSDKRGRWFQHNKAHWFKRTRAWHAYATGQWPGRANYSVDRVTESIALSAKRAGKKKRKETSNMPFISAKAYMAIRPMLAREWGNRKKSSTYKAKLRSLGKKTTTLLQRFTRTPGDWWKPGSADRGARALRRWMKDKGMPKWWMNRAIKWAGIYRLKHSLR